MTLVRSSIVLTFFYVCESFLPSWIRIRIHSTAAVIIKKTCYLGRRLGEFPGSVPLNGGQAAVHCSQVRIRIRIQNDDHKNCYLGRRLV
jgi:hypothetical protein